MDMTGLQDAALSLMGRPSKITEFLAFAIAAFAIPFGIGSAALKGYLQGKCALPGQFVYMVNSPLGVAMLLRIATFVLDEKYYYFFITLDGIGFLLAIVIQMQVFGFFLKSKEPRN